MINLTPQVYVSPEVKDNFESYQADIQISDILNFNQFIIHFEIDVASISTSDVPRDTHLI